MADLLLFNGRLEAGAASPTRFAVACAVLQKARCLDRVGLSYK